MSKKISKTLRDHETTIRVDRAEYDLFKRTLGDSRKVGRTVMALMKFFRESPREVREGILVKDADPPPYGQTLLNIIDDRLRHHRLIGGDDTDPAQPEEEIDKDEETQG